MPIDRFTTQPELTEQKGFLQRLLSIKINIVPAALVFGVMLAVGVAFVANSQPPTALRMKAAEPTKKVASYGYLNPRVEAAQGPVRVPAGSHDVPAYVFNVYAPSDRDITTNQYTLPFVNTAGLITKFSLLKDNVVLGTTVPSTGSGQISFKSPVTIAAGTYARFVIATDVSATVPPPPVYGYPAPTMFFVGVQSISYTDSKPSNMLGLPQTNSVTVSDHDPGLLNGALSPITPPERTVVAGSHDVDTAHIAFTAANNDVVIKQVTVGAAASGRTGFKNIKVYDKDAGALLATLPTLNQSYGDITMGVAVFNSPLVITKGTVKVLRITTDLVPGQAFDFSMGVVGLAAVDQPYYTGPMPLLGNKVKITLASQGKLSVQLDPAGPAAQKIFPGSADVELARFKLSAALLNDINLDKITLGVSGITNDSLLTNIRIYDDTTAVASLKRFTNRTRDGLTGVATFRTPSTITQGTTKTFRIVADVAASGQQGQQFKTGMVAIEQPPSVTVVGLPLYGPLATIVKPVRR